MIQLTPEQIAHKKKIGSLKGKPVFEIKTKGGFFVVAAAGDANKKSEILGTGSHRAIARHIAEKNAPEFKIDALEKSDFELELYQEFIPYYEKLTDDLRRVQSE